MMESGRILSRFQERKPVETAFHGRTVCRTRAGAYSTDGWPPS
jgi:hypothetical protein